METLEQYINKNYAGNKSKFGRSLPEPVSPQQITQWINAGFVVVDHVLYSKRRNLK